MISDSTTMDSIDSVSYRKVHGDHKDIDATIQRRQSSHYDGIKGLLRHRLESLGLPMNGESDDLRSSLA